MSKSPSTQIFIPALGGAALVLGVAYGAASRQYGNDRIEALQAQFEKERSTVAALETSLDDLQASNEQSAQEAVKEITGLKRQLQTALNSAGSAGSATRIAAPAPSAPGGNFGIGRPALPEEISAWNVDVLPDGRGLPEGSGDVWTGEEVFVEKCAACHGDFAEGRDAWPVLAGGFDTLADEDPVKTVGSYWPYLSTVWDYVHRSMPFGNAGTLSADETYAITAYILYSNDLVDDDFVLSRETFADVAMYNADGFIVDDRPAVEYKQWSGEPCMQDCKSTPAAITRRASDVGVTPADDGSMAESLMEQQLATLGGVEWGKERVAGSVFMGPGGIARDEAPEDGTQMASAEDTTTATDAVAGPDPALVAKGEKGFKKCASCHQVGEGAKNRSGPQLNGVVGRAVGGLEGFKYSGAFKTALEEGMVWNDETLAGFLANPKGYIKGTKMSFRGIKDPADIEAMIAYLGTFGE